MHKDGTRILLYRRSLLLLLLRPGPCCIATTIIDKNSVVHFSLLYLCGRESPSLSRTV
jgi:hypothetical protein